MPGKKKLPKLGNGELPRIEDPRDSDVIIPVMGPTGSGKSSFINTVMGQNVAEVGHGLRSRTTEIQPVIMDPHPNDPSRRLIFVDTPGFDDTFIDDTEILRRISVWLALSYYDGMQVAGVIYLHGISQTRMQGTSRRYLDVFSRLCGDSALDKVILATTMWDVVKEKEGAERELDLRRMFWKKMISQGSTMFRFTGTYESAWDIVHHILQPRILPLFPLSLLIQQELIDLQKLLPETEAGRCLREALEHILEKQKEMARELKDGQNLQQDDELRREYEDNQRKIRSTLAQIKNLKIPLSRRIAIFSGIR